MEFIIKMYQGLVEYFPQIVSALIVLVIGIVAVSIINRIFRKALSKRHTDNALASFLRPFIKVTLYIIVVIIALSTAGVPTATLLAAFGTVGLAFGLAVKDSLANVAGGILLLAAKPFTIGDYIQVGDLSGTVESISVLYTRLSTIDNRLILIPNGQITADKIVNMSASLNRRLDLTFDISYSDDTEKAKAVIAKAVEENPLALSDPLPIIRVSELTERSVRIACYVWAKKEDLMDLKYDLTETMKADLEKNGITIPFSQVNVHLMKESSEKGA